MILKIIVWE